MNREQKYIKAELVINLLKNGQPIINFDIYGEIKFSSDNYWENKVIFDNCTIEEFTSFITFHKKVKFINCHFKKKCLFISTYFIDGLFIDKCLFDNYIDFQAGGHNQNGSSIIISNNTFKGFVNFFDCWYESE
ncbi:MAG: hypothetical protein LBN23_01785, partial [Paludibacter sp.]|nr:hypothetical protein [Paludibacter sp.]